MEEWRESLLQICSICDFNVGLLQYKSCLKNRNIIEGRILNDVSVKDECQGTIENLKLIALQLENDVKELEKSVLSMPSAQEMLQQAKKVLFPDVEAKENIKTITSPITPNRARFAIPNFTPKYEFD
jgi:hypothetical protein